MRRPKIAVVPRVRLGLDRGALLVIPRVARERLLELAHAPADRAPDLGQLLRAEHDQRDREDDDELHGADVRHPVSSRIEWSGPEL
jgi:hypothetical protein